MNILIINAGCKVHGQGGTLSKTLVDEAVKTLTGLGHEVVVTDLNNEWDVTDEATKVLAADAIIVQTPGWWMSTPWQFKKYEDEVFCEPRMQANDGRTRSNPEKKYGSGGIHTGKKYMLSSTWNAPLEAFTDPKQFFEGRGFDGLFMPVHKTFEFLGMKKLPSFMVNDVFKNPTIEADLKRWEAHLKQVFG